MSLYDDPVMRSRIHELFETVWPRLPERIALAASLGADWHAVSTPFVVMEGDDVIAHVGVIEFPLVLAGERRLVAGVHAVATHPEHRYRGHCGRLLEEAVSYAARHSEIAQLTTELPRVFRPAGFREIAQTCFELAVPRFTAPPLRRLSHEAVDDVALVWRLLAARTPLSHRLGVVEPGWLFFIDEVLASYGFDRLYYAADLDAVVALEVKDDVLRLYDIVAPTLPPIEEIAARVATPFERVQVFFSPDRFSLPIVAEREAYPGDFLMVRGPYAVEGEKLALPILAHC